MLHLHPMQMLKKKIIAPKYGPKIKPQINPKGEPNPCRTDIQIIPNITKPRNVKKKLICLNSIKYSVLDFMKL